MAKNQIGDISNNSGVNIAIGKGDISQRVLVNEMPDKIFKEWLKEIETIPDVGDVNKIKKDVADIKERLINKKISIAEKLFKALPTVIQTTASALEIAQLYGFHL